MTQVEQYLHQYHINHRLRVWYRRRRRLMLVMHRQALARSNISLNLQGLLVRRLVTAHLNQGIISPNRDIASQGTTNLNQDITNHNRDITSPNQGITSLNQGITSPNRVTTSLNQGITYHSPNLVSVTHFDTCQSN